MTQAATIPSVSPSGVPTRATVLDIRNVSKRFGPTQALDNVSVTMLAGEVHALMGENGAGKSTLGKAIAGLHKPDTGQILLEGGELEPGSVHEAFRRGVRIVHQELAQCPNLTVAENLCLHDLPTRGGVLDLRTMNDRAARLLSTLAPEIDVQAPLGTLAPGRRQIVQIAASLDERPGPDGRPAPAAKVIIFDEPTSSLSVSEADRLIGIVRRLAASGILCVYVSHRMNEIFQACDRITVLRDGKFVATSVIKETTEAVVVSQMIGRTLASHGKQRGGAAALAGGHMPHGGAVALQVSNLRSPGKLSGISLSVKAGEILGVGGLVGAGRSELLDAIFGLDKDASGTVSVAGNLISTSGPGKGWIARAIDSGIGYVPEDRRLQGLFFDLGIDENILMPEMPRLARLGLRSIAAERAAVTARIQRFRIKAASPAFPPGTLSGGNQQKLLIARWMTDRTKVLLLDEPTRGIDVGTKSEVYRLIFEAADAGMAVLLVSSEMPELLALADRLIVLCEGDQTGELTGEQMTQENILRLATTKHAVAAGV